MKTSRILADGGSFEPALTSHVSSLSIFSQNLALFHFLLLSAGLVSLYGWMGQLPFYADSLYMATNEATVRTPWDLLMAFDPRADLVHDEATRVVALYRPVFLELTVPLLRYFESPLVCQAATLIAVLATTLAIYLFSWRLSGCQDSAFVVAAFFALHPVLFECLLVAFAGLNAMLAYCFIALALLVSRRFALHSTWTNLLLALTFTFLGVFTWERILLLPIGLALLILGWRLFDPRVSGEDAEVPLARRLPAELADPSFLLFLGGGLAIIVLYSLGRIARYGSLMSSHHSLGTSASGMLEQATALVLGALGLVPPMVPPWLGVHFGRMPLTAQLGLLGYSLLVVWLLLGSLRRRPVLASLGVLLGGLLIAPTFSASQLISLRYADCVVLGLTVTMSVAPLLAGTRRQRVARSLAMVAVMATASALYQVVQFTTPRQWPDHFLTRSARLADAVQNTVNASHLLPSSRPVLLLSQFFNREATWIFNATPSRLGSFFSANFGIPREQVERFSPERLTGQAAIIVDLYYRTHENFLEPVSAVSEARHVEAEQPIEWRLAQQFRCSSGSVLVIRGREPAPGQNDNQYVRVNFSGAEQSFNMIELFGANQERIPNSEYHETRVYALVPKNVDRCQIVPEGLQNGATITDVSTIALRR